METLENSARESNRLYKDAQNNGLAEEEITTLLMASMEKWKMLLSFKKIQAQLFPLEVCFGVYDNENNNTVPNVSPSVRSLPPPKPADMPFLVAPKESTRHNKQLVTLSVKEFIDHFEEMLTLSGMLINDTYHRYLPLLVSKSYKSFIELKRKALAPHEQESWNMVKQWLLEFSLTPRQRVKNLQSFLSMMPTANESGDDFFFRLQQSYDYLDMSKVSSDVFAFFAIMQNVDGVWKTRLSEAVKDGGNSFLEKDFAGMCALACDLDLDGRRQHGNTAAAMAATTTATTPL
jgi:hypothetical protein